MFLVAGVRQLVLVYFALGKTRAARLRRNDRSGGVLGEPVLSDAEPRARRRELGRDHRARRAVRAAGARTPSHAHARERRRCVPPPSRSRWPARRLASPAGSYSLRSQASAPASGLQAMRLGAAVLGFAIVFIGSARAALRCESNRHDCGTHSAPARSLNPAPNVSQPARGTGRRAAGAIWKRTMAARPDLSKARARAAHRRGQLSSRRQRDRTVSAAGFAGDRLRRAQ